MEARVCGAAAESPVGEVTSVAKLRAAELVAVGTAEAVLGVPSRGSVWTTWATSASRHSAALGRAGSAPVEMEGQAAPAVKAGPAGLEARADRAARAAVAALKLMPRLR